jgi:hypothetical protein
MSKDRRTDSEMGRGCLVRLTNFRHIRDDGKAWEHYTMSDKGEVYVLMLLGSERKVGGERPSANDYLKALGWTPPSGEKGADLLNRSLVAARVLRDMLANRGLLSGVVVADELIAVLEAAKPGD